MDAPTPIKPTFEENTVINLNELNNTHEFTYNEYTITIGLYYDYLIIFTKSNNDSECFQLKNTYEQVIENIPNFKMLSSISEILLLMKQFFESNKFDIKKEGLVLKVIIKLKNMLGKDEEHELILQKLELNNKQKMEMMEERIKKLENQILNITKEKEELKNKIQILTEENKNIKEDLNIIKRKLNIIPNDEIKSKINENSITEVNNSITRNDNVTPNNINKKIIFHSKIFNDISEIDFILNEIKKIGNNISRIDLLYRASDDGDKIEKMNDICNNKDNELFIIKTIKGYIFGGFTKIGFNNKSKDIFDPNAFIFSYNLKKIYNIKNPQYALHRQSGDGRFSFGSSSYVFLFGRNFLKKNSSSTDKMIDYLGENLEREINGGDKNFQILELEVFQIRY